MMLGTGYMHHALTWRRRVPADEDKLEKVAAVAEAAAEEKSDVTAAAAEMDDELGQHSGQLESTGGRITEAQAKVGRWLGWLAGWLAWRQAQGPAILALASTPAEPVAFRVKSTDTVPPMECTLRLLGCKPSLSLRRRRRSKQTASRRRLWRRRRRR